MMSPCSWLALFVLVFAMSVNGLENMTVEDIVHGHRNHRVKGPHRWDASHNYRDALSKSILFFEGQRSGRLPPNQRLNWRGDSALSDGAAAHVDLVGGYYDAGDNVKFGLPMAFTTTMLSWSVLEFGGLMGGELSNAKAAIRWATDYLLKATVHPNTIYVQVGDAAKDHQCWERPEDMDTVRTVLKVDPSTPGTEVASETAAALAAASLVFRKSDKAYSKVLLQRAIMVFNFANRFRGSYTGSSLRRSICPYYCSFSGYQDELLWGAAWLHKATRKSWYLYFLNSNAANFGAYASDSVFGWDDKHAGVRVLLSKEFLINKVKSVEEYRQHADFSICSLIPGNSYSSAKYTRGGLLYRMTDTNLQYVTSASFLLFTYAKYLSASRQRISCGSGVVTPHTLRAIAKRQVDYILGENPEGMSYMVGYGKKYPMRVHHRGSSLPSKRTHPQKIACGVGFQAMSSSAPNPNVLVGAIVGGPDQNDLFKDQRSDFMQSEPATYINAPFVGSLAYLSHSTSH